MSTTRKPRAKARTNDSLTEMQLMRDQLAAAASRREANESQADAPTAEPTAAEPEHEAEEQLSELKQQFDQFLEKLNDDLSEIPAATAIGIFALGILVGRLLPR